MTLYKMNSRDEFSSTCHRIDVHHHISPPNYVAETRDLLLPPAINWTPLKSLDDMEQGGVKTSILSVSSPGVWLGDNRQGRRLARECNEYAAKLVSDHPSRFAMFAALPLPDIEGSLSELEYSLDVLKAHGVGLLTSYNDKWLGDSAFEPVMEELNRRQVVVYTHPDAPLCCRGLLPGVLDATLEFGLDTTRAIANIMFSGTARRFRDIRWIFSHGGGVMPFLNERLVRTPQLNREFVKSVPDGVMSELQRFFYDTAQIGNQISLSALSKTVPISQILWGSDFPYRRNSEYLEPLSVAFSVDDLQDIEFKNAISLMPRLSSETYDLRTSS